MRKALPAVLAVALVAPIPGVAFAQADDEVIFEEVIVTATRREGAVMDVPQSIQAISEAQLELPTLSDLSEVHNLVPGAVSFGNKAPARESIQMRGSGIVQSGAIDGQSPVGYYVDDIPFVDFSTPTPPPIGTFDLQRIEVLRGPQGTTYGQDSSAGSILLRTNPVDLENFGYKVRAGFSSTESTSDSGYLAGGVVNIPIVEDVFGIRIGYQREMDPGYGTVDGAPGFDDPLANSRDTLRAKMFWQATEKLSLEVTHSEWNTDYTILPGSQILDSTQGKLVHSPVETPILLQLFPDGEVENKYEISWTTLLARYEFDFAELTYSVGRVDTPRKETNQEVIFDVGLGPQKSGVVFNQPAESTTQELRLVSTGDGALQWLGGLFFLDGESDSGGMVDTPDFFFREAVNDPIESEVMAIYAEVDYAFNDAWSASFGLRYHDEDRTDTSIQSQTEFFPNFTYFTDPFFGPQSDVTPTSRQKYSIDHLSHRIGLTWSPHEDGMVYITHSTANRAPIILTENERRTLATAGFSQIGDTDAAELENIEIGTKWTLGQGRVQVEAAYILGDWADIPLWAQVQVPGMPISMPIGGTDADVTVIELAINWAITDDLRINYAYVNTDTEVTSVPPPGLVSNYPGAVRDGGELYNYAPETHNVGLSWSRDAVIGEWGMYLSANYVSRDKVDGINVFVAPDAYVSSRDRYENMMFNVGAVKGPWDVTFSVSNLTDDDGQYLPRTELGGSDAQLFGLIQQPRTYTLQISYDGMP